MYPSNPSGIGIPSPFGIAPSSSSVHGGSNLVDDSCAPTFSWLTQFGGQSSALMNDQPAAGIKVGPTDQMFDRSSFMSLERHTPSFQRLTSHSIVSSGSNQSMESHGSQQSDGASVGTFHPYRPSSDGIPGAAAAAAVAHSSLSNSQFAAFDSIYKAYQNAYSSGSATASMFGNQPYRYDSAVMAAEQQMLLQASLLQYPHVGLFPNPAIYPNLQSGLRYPGDYYCQNLASLSFMSKYPDITGPSWLGIDRSSAVSAFVGEREKDMKEYDSRKEQADLSKRLEKDVSSEHHKIRHDREEARRDTKVDDLRKEQNSSRHILDKEAVKSEQQRQATSLRSPARHEQRLPDISFNKFNPGHNEYTFTATRLHSGVSCASTVEPLNLQKPMLSPRGTAQQQQRNVTGKREQNFELSQEYTAAKERFQIQHSKPDEIREKRGLPLPCLPKSSSTTNSVLGSQFKAQYEQKFHRPFEQVQQQQQQHTSLTSRNDANEVFDVQLGILGSARDRSQNNSRASSAHDRKDYMMKTVSDGKSMTRENHHLHHHHHRQHHHQQQQQQQQMMMMKANDRKTSLAFCGSKRRFPDVNDDMPLNLALTKVTHLDSSVVREHGQSRPRSNICGQEPVAECVVNNFAKKKLSGVVAGSNSFHMGKGKRDTLGLDQSKVSSQRKTLVSKIDKMLAKKSKAAEKNSNDDSDGDEESGGNTSKDVARCLLITSGPPLADENSARKIQFLGIFGLVTVDTCRELKFKQQRRRRRQMRESSISPVDQLENAPGSSCYDASGLTTTKDVTDICCTTTDKDSLLHHLQLRSVNAYRGPQTSSHLEPSSQTQAAAARVTPLNQNSKRQRLMTDGSASGMPSRCGKSIDGCNSKQERVQLQMPTTEFPNYLLNSSRCERLQQVDSNSGSQQDPSESSFAFDINRSQPKTWLLGSDHLTTGTNCQGSCNSSRVDGQGAAPTDESHTQFSDALLIKSTTPRCSSSISKEPFDGSSSLTANALDAATAFHWPGHEAVIESYYHYIEERSMERQFLVEQNRRLHHLNTELIQKTEQLQCHLTGLLQTKEQLTDNRCQIQSVIDNLKVSLQAFQ